MTLTLDNGQVLKLVNIDSNTFSRFETTEPNIKGMGGVVSPELGSYSLRSITPTLVIYPAIKVAGQNYAFIPEK